MRGAGPKDEDRQRVIDVLYEPIPWLKSNPADTAAAENAAFSAAMRQNGRGG